MLDMLAQGSEQVATGSVQVFDMEVVRDTKDTSFNFGTGALVGTFGALIVAAHGRCRPNMFASDEAGAEGGTPDFQSPRMSSLREICDSPPERTSKRLQAPTLPWFSRTRRASFTTFRFSLAASRVGALLTGCKAGCDPGKAPQVYTPLKSGPFSEEFTFTTPGVGEYAFQCAAHQQMTGP